MAITFRQLQHFLVLSEQLHFGRAARLLNISQPPLSASLKQLEEHLGFQLIDRSSKTVRLTPAGVVFAEHAARILGQLRSAQEIAGQTARGTVGKLTVAFVPSMLYRRLPALLKDFQERFPQVELHLQEMNSTRQIEQLISHKIDVGFVHATPFPDAIATLPLEVERLMCCVPRQHRLAGRSQVSLRELAGERILVFARDFAAHYHDRIVGLLRSAHVEPHLNYRIQSWFTVIALVSQGMGVSIVPRSLIRSHVADVTYIELAEPTAEHHVALAWRMEANSDACSAFVASIREHYHPLTVS
ncbi:LysR family transcriptional regulator [Xanthobacter variabilis]|uniref:LysR family transcriptional regulator n=1 Tax=Xanthobacter variabilis TaxID=3119932 RepID=UPI00374E4D40